MKIANSVSKEKWNEFLILQKQSQFLQAWEWGELAGKKGAQVMRLGIEEGGELIAVATLIKKSIAGFSYWFCPRGPVIGVKSLPAMPVQAWQAGEKLKVESFLFDEIEKIAKREKTIFLRFEPELEIGNWKLEIERSINIEPNKTLVVDLSKTEDELLSAMHQKTRYNIRLAEKKGVTVRIAGAEDFNGFWRIMKQTEGRDNFRLHQQQHYQQMLDLDKNFIRLFLAEYKGKILAAVLASFFGDMVTYIHGASADEDRNVMAPYLLHWQIMNIAKAAGYKYYDLNGIDESKWPGVTRFKMGFGGETVEYPGTYDLVFNKKMYNFYRVLRRIRRMT